MSQESPTVMPDTGASKMLAVQAMLISCVAWGFFAYQGQTAAQAAMYGGLIVMINVWMMNRRVRAAAQLAQVANGKEIRVLYVAAVQRFVLTLVWFILGMGWLSLPPIPMLIAFALAQTGYFIGGLSIRKNSF